VQRVRELLALLPELAGRGLLDASGGSFAVRSSRGIYITPAQAGAQLGWKLTEDDLVLFPGDGEASMARAGRQPHRENRLLRAALYARGDWNAALRLHWPGLMSFALAGRAVPLPAEHAASYFGGGDMALPCVERREPGHMAHSERIGAALSETFAGEELGAVLLAGLGPLIAGAELQRALGFAERLERLAVAQAYLLHA
jgi:ribulose-5-phosphate 4-epimerase/fuculose-1-phosphate aldolase